MALRTNRLNAQGYAACIFAGGVEAWALKRLDLLKNTYAGEGGIDDKSGFPNGYNMGAQLLPLKAGGMSSFNPAILNLVKSDADAKMGRALEGSSALSIVTTNAQADQIVALVGSGTLALASSNGAMSAGVEGVASASLAISANATLGGIIPVIASAACAIAADCDLSAEANMEAAAGGPTELSPEGLTEELLDNSDIETGMSMRESLRLMLAAMAGEISGAPGTTITIRNTSDTKNRIVATVDSNGNRTALTYDTSEG